MKEPLVLLVEDNPHIMDINTAALTMRGCRVLQAATVQACREQLRLHDVELIALDILLPDGDGLTLCREIKENYDIPILFLSALGENEDIVQGLTAGGDDYLPKPFAYPELLASISALLRRGDTDDAPTMLSRGRLSVDTVRRLAYADGRPLDLAPREYALLEELLRADGGWIDTRSLLESLWPSETHGQPDLVKTAVYSLRRRLPDPTLIASSRGEGYRIP